MEKLFSFQDNLLKNNRTDSKRYLYDGISFDNQMLAIKGIRRVGKTTLLLQYIKTQNPAKLLYITADYPWFYTNGLLDTAEEWHKQGGRLLIITASSALDIYRGEADLSRRFCRIHCTVYPSENI